jgi:hypothetical protein
MDADKLNNLFKLLENASADPDDAVLEKIAALASYRRLAQKAGRHGHLDTAVDYENRADNLEVELLERVAL